MVEDFFGGTFRSQGPWASYISALRIKSWMKGKGRMRAQVSPPLPLSCFSVSGDVPSEYPLRSGESRTVAISASISSAKQKRATLKLSLCENAPLLKITQCVLKRLSWCAGSSTLSPLPACCEYLKT